MGSLLESDHKQVVLQQLQAFEAPLLLETRRQATAAIGKTHANVSDALRWLTAEGSVADASAIGLVLLPDAVMVTASCEFV